jgi:hypothetical protein
MYVMMQSFGLPLSVAIPVTVIFPLSSLHCLVKVHNRLVCQTGCRVYLCSPIVPCTSCSYVQFCTPISHYCF